MPVAGILHWPNQPWHCHMPLFWSLRMAYLFAVGGKLGVAHLIGLSPDAAKRTGTCSRS